MIIDDLIFNRTLDDVERVKELKTRILEEGLNSLSDAEKTEYLSGMRGAYNYTDLNRVGQAVAYIANRMITLPATLDAYREAQEVGDDPMFDLPYDPAKVDVDPKTNWSVSDIPTQTQMKKYLANITNLRSILTLPSGIPFPPSTMNSLTYVVANNIERILQAVDQRLTEVETELKNLIDRVPPGYVYSGEGLSGEI